MRQDLPIDVSGSQSVPVGPVVARTLRNRQSVMRLDMREMRELSPYHDKVPDSTAWQWHAVSLPFGRSPAYLHRSALPRIIVVRAPAMLTTSVYHIEPSRSSGSEFGSASSTTQKLVMTTTSLRNVVLANASDVLYYEVVTPVWERHLTRVSRLDIKTRGFNVVAEMLNGHPPGDVKGREEDAKRVMAYRMYGGGEYRAVDEFLHVEANPANGGENARPDPKGKGKEREKGMDEIRAWFRGKDGFRYTWHAGEKHSELFREDHPNKPVAAFHKEKRFLNVLRISQYPYLEVDPSTIETLDYLVISFLLIERLRRERWCS
ncbi:hypothetical protein L226DRAFT_104552 [Lentinus tigrinus ALCF2SS1-7]|uniref:DUF6593 domain-containing protein n=1 Tax=Lentinus tigrinus ALCF2SS1-6 TaxID=1328759 RepID=A0A5C2S839_9APHY|nr:hypothetical protein L227DRAFT_168297 [Lentinus tigrinus ALCF2SS1-6]RPD73626.1 hypothetical protein L226DRAFT_104552 [Lentinus tigrinus ALCF2SS1-7]